MPNHPQGIVHDGYRGRPVIRRQVDGYRVTHVWVHTSPTKTARTRLAFYGSYTAMATIAGAMLRRPDVIFASSPPLPVAAAAATVAARHRVPWVMDVRDLWPSIAIALGELKGDRSVRAAEWLERALYRDATAITVVTRPFVDAVTAVSGQPEKIHHLPNGTTRFWLEERSEPADRSSLGLPADRFIWTFAGNLGVAQGLDTAIAAAGLLDSRFLFVLVGDGPERAKLEHLAAQMAPDRTAFREQVSAHEAREHLRASDAVLVSLAATNALSAFVPSKLFDCCAVGTPVVLTACGEAERLASAAKAAFTVPPGEPAALAQALTALRENPGLGALLSGHGRGFATEHLRETQVERLERILDDARRKRADLPQS